MSFRPSLLVYFRPLESGTLTVRDVKEWVIEKEDVSAYLSNYTQARMIVSSLKVKSLESAPFHVDEEISLHGH